MHHNNSAGVGAPAFLPLQSKIWFVLSPAYSHYTVYVHSLFSLFCSPECVSQQIPPNQSFPVGIPLPFTYSFKIKNSKMKSEQDRFRFTPTKILPKVPHVWERKPSTPFMARPKSRKVWKRFRSSFSSTKQLKQLTASHGDSVYHDAYDYYEGLQTEINVAKSFGFLRGVKRLCLQLGDDDTVDGDSDRGRSFLETKWEEDVVRRKREPF